MTVPLTVYFATPLTVFILGLCGCAAWTVIRTKKVPLVEGRVLRMRQRAAAAANMPQPNLVPLPADLIKRLASYDLTAPGRHDDVEECIVCQESLDDKELGAVCMLPCRHIFHRTCLSEWLSRVGSCPTCRRPLVLPRLRPQPALQSDGTPSDDVETGGVQVVEVSVPVTDQTASQGPVDIEMQTLHPATSREEQVVIDSQTSLLELKCWQDLSPEEAGVHDNRWLLSCQPSGDDTQPETADLR